jgi:predicted permease
MGLFILLVLTVLFLLGLLLSGVFARERFRRGVLVQAQFRSNYAVIGLPVVTALAGNAGAQMASFLQFPTIMFYNFMSVIVLMIFADYEAQYRLYNEGPLADMRPEEREKMPAPSAGMDIAAILKGIAANPLIQGLTAGFAVLLLREVIPVRPDGALVFSLQRDIPWLYSAISSLARMATPLALVVLGGQLEMKEIRGFRTELIAAVIMRLIVAPAIGFGLILAAARMGYLEVGPVEIAVLIAVFGSPSAVSSIVMSSEMGGDGHLAGQIVVWTSILGMVSLFFIVFFMRLGGLL